MEPLVRAGLLFDFYGGLLTEKQRRVMELYFLEDWSLAEIAAETGVSRQAVHDLIHRSERLMEEYEAKLGLMRRFLGQQEELRATSRKLAVLIKKNEAKADFWRELTGIKATIDQLLEKE
jgi:predicted DNA-binding protein YlxM (UPF0122 family)